MKQITRNVFTTLLSLVLLFIIIWVHRNLFWFHAYQLTYYDISADTFATNAASVLLLIVYSWFSGLLLGLLFLRKYQLHKFVTGTLLFILVFTIIFYVITFPINVNVLPYTPFY